MKVNLPFLHLSLLKAKKIRIKCGKDFCEAFAAHGAESINIPRNEFHNDGVLKVFIYTIEAIAAT